MAQHCYQIAVDRKHSPDPKIQVGDQVFILAKFIKTTQPSKKLAEHYLGPFEVLGKPEIHSYLVKLLNHLKELSIPSSMYSNQSQYTLAKSQTEITHCCYPLRLMDT